jgi:hypothetical protein
MLHEYHVICSIQYYLQFHVAAVGLGMYYLWTQGHCCTDNQGTLTAPLEHVLANNYCVNVLHLRTNQNLKLINCVHQSSRLVLVTKLFKKLPAFNGIQMFITTFTTAHHGLHPQPVIFCPHATGYSTILGISGTMVC